jgi:phospholipid transport system substrate-binding protein
VNLPALLLALLAATPTDAEAERTVRLLLAGVARPAGPAEAELRPLLDVEGLARFVLGPEWERRPARDRAEFVALLGQLLAQRAFPKAARFFAEVKVEFRGVAAGPERTARVDTTVTSPDEGTVEVAYGLSRVDDRWRIADVVLDGVSLRVNLRATSRKVLESHGYDELVARMRRRLAEGTE